MLMSIGIKGQLRVPDLVGQDSSPAQLRSWTGRVRISPKDP